MEHLRNVFTDDVLDKFRSLQQPSLYLDERYEIIKGTPLIFPRKGYEPNPHYITAKRKMWDQYVECARTHGMFDADKEGQDLLARLRGIDDRNFDSAMAECIACWYFTNRLGYKVVPKPKLSNGKIPEFLIRMDHFEAVVEVKTTLIEYPMRKWHTFGAARDYRSDIDEASKKLAKGAVNIVVLMPVEAHTDGSALYHLGRFLLDSDRLEFEKVLYGSQTAMLQINPETEEEESSTRRREDGFFRNRKNGQPSGTRVSVVLLLEEGTRLSNQGDCQEVEICHNAVAMHNPNAGVRVEIERFCNIPQYVFENGELSRINPKSAIEA